MSELVLMLLCIIGGTIVLAALTAGGEDLDGYD